MEQPKYQVNVLFNSNNPTLRHFSFDVVNENVSQEEVDLQIKKKGFDPTTFISFNVEKIMYQVNVTLDFQNPDPEGKPIQKNLAFEIDNYNFHDSISSTVINDEIAKKASNMK